METEHNVEIFSKRLIDDDLPAPMMSDSHVTDSTVAPFSNKLMMFHNTALIAIGIMVYGLAMSNSPRHDLGVMYARLISEISLYGEDGANLMIQNGWLEEPPQAANRQQLVKRCCENQTSECQPHSAYRAIVY